LGLRHEGISVQFKFGMSTFDLTAGQSYQASGGMGGELRIQINYDIIPINTSFGIFSQGHLGSNVGSFPMSRVGLATYYFPFGHPLASMPLDNNVTISQSRISLFVMGAGAFSALAITDISGAHPLSFNGSAIVFQMGGGSRCRSVRPFRSWARSLRGYPGRGHERLERQFELQRFELFVQRRDVRLFDSSVAVFF